MHRSKKSMLVVALALATTAGGCGSGDDDQTASTPEGTSGSASFGGDSTPAPKVPSEYAVWAKSFCTAMAKNAEQIQPPQVKAGSASETQKSLVDFFSTIVDQQATQLDAIKEVGPPPGDEARTAWKKAQSELEEVRDAVDDLSAQIKAADADTESDVTKMVDSLKTKMAKLGSYQGPIVQLQKTSKLGPALAAEPACAGTTPPTS